LTRKRIKHHALGAAAPRACEALAINGLPERHKEAASGCTPLVVTLTARQSLGR